MHKSITIFVIIVFPSLLCLACIPMSPANSIPAIKVPFALPWDLAHKDSSTVQDFMVTEDRFYQFQISFKCLAQEQSDICREILKNLRPFVGEGSHRYITKESQGTDRPIQVPQHTREEEQFLSRKGLLVGGSSTCVIGEHERLTGRPPGVVAEMVPDGVIIPVHLRIEHIDRSGVTSVHTDEVWETVGLSGHSSNELIRSITSIRLKPGKYRLHAKTTMETAIPTDIETRLVGTWNPKAAPVESLSTIIVSSVGKLFTEECP